MEYVPTFFILGVVHFVLSILALMLSYVFSDMEEDYKKASSILMVMCTVYIIVALSLHVFN